MRHRNARVSRTCNCRGNSRHNFKLNSSIDDRLRFFRAASENKRIAAFQPHDIFSGSRFFDQERVDFVLLERVFARSLSRMNNLDVIPRPAEHFRVCKMIANNHVGILDAFFRPQRHQAEITRPRADEINLSPFARAHARNRLNSSLARSCPFAGAPSTSPWRGVLDPSSKNCACIFIMPSSILASTPTGALQSTSSKRKNSRSARKQSNVSESFTGLTIPITFSSPDRIWIAMIPCPPAGKKISRGNVSKKNPNETPSRSTPAPASTTASQLFSASLRNRVGTFPRRSTIERSERFQRN